MFMLPLPSHEQQIILDHISDGKNTIVHGLAGGGKSSLILHAIMQNPSKKGFMISYNRGLVDETNLMINKLEESTGMDIRSRIVVVTYHSLLSMICNKVIDDDLLFLIALTTIDFDAKRTSWKFANFDFVIIDEGQDMRATYFRLVINLIIKLCIFPANIQILAVGDEIQLLYDFYAVNRADSRFLVCLDQLLVGVSTRPWVRASLSTSYRSTAPMANFINSLFTKRTTIPKPASVVQRAKEKFVTIYILDLYKDSPRIILPTILKTHKTKSILIICSSLNEKSSAVGIVDLLVENGLQVHVARSGTLSDSGSSHQNQSTTKNKILLKTKHGSKGLEADEVHTISNTNIFEYYKHPLENSDYVALTRARESLYVHIDYRNVSEYELKKYIFENPQLRQKDVRIVLLRDIKLESPLDLLQLTDEQHKLELKKKQEKQQQTNFTTNTLFSFLDVTHLQCLLSLLTCSETQPPLENLIVENPQEQDELKSKQLGEAYFHQMNITYDQGQTYINVTNICGLAITMALEYTITKCIPLLMHKMYAVCISKPQDEKYQALRKKLEVAIHELRTNTSREPTLDPINQTLKHFKIFAQMGALLDVFTGYSEKLHSLKNYDFINKPSIFERFRVLFASVSTIIAKHDIKINDLVWYREEVGRFKYDEKSITVNIKPTLISKCGSLLIDIVHTPCISHEHHLSALVAAQIAGNVRTNVYIVNIGNGAIEHSKLIEKENAGLEFVSKAITFKLCKDENPDDANFMGTFHNLVKETAKQRTLFDLDYFAKKENNK